MSIAVTGLDSGFLLSAFIRMMYCRAAQLSVESPRPLRHPSTKAKGGIRTHVHLDFAFPSTPHRESHFSLRCELFAQFTFMSDG